MTVTWGSMSGREAADNAAFEQSCHEQAKLEVSGEGMAGFDYIKAVLKRAQEIKLERRGQ